MLTNWPTTALDMVMPRSLFLPISMMILIAIAMAMLAGSMLLPTSEAIEFSASSWTEVVDQFYAAVNETIVTGNAVALSRVVHPSFADEDPLPGVDPSRAGLEAYLVALHDADPSLRLKAEVISASAGLVVTQVEVLRQAKTSVSAPSGEALAAWSPIEVFRVADSVIVRRWGHTDGLALAKPLAAQRLELPVPTPRIVSLMRVTLASGTRWDAPRVAGPRLLYLEEGVLDVQADTTQRVMLTAGKDWQAPPGSITSTTSVGSTAAHLLVVTFAEPRIPNGTVPEPEAGNLPAGITAQVLAGDLATNLGTGSLIVTLELVAFAPDADLNLWSTEGPILLAVQTGQLDTTTRGTAWVRRSRDGMSVASRAGIQTTENGMFLQPGGVVALQNAERRPASALVVTIRSEGEGRGT